MYFETVGQPGPHATAPKIMFLQSAARKQTAFRDPIVQIALYWLGLFTYIFPQTLGGSIFLKVDRSHLRNSATMPLLVPLFISAKRREEEFF
jgi:hypothetical protein